MPESVLASEEEKAGAELAPVGEVRFTMNATMAGCVEKDGVPDGDTDTDVVSDMVCDGEPVGDCEEVTVAVSDTEGVTVAEGETEGLTEELAVTELETGIINGTTTADALMLVTRRIALLFRSATTTPVSGMTATPAGL